MLKQVPDCTPVSSFCTKIAQASKVLHQLIQSCSDPMLLVHINDLLHLVIAAQKDTASIVDVLRHDSDHPAHLAVDCLTTSYELH